MPQTSILLLLALGCASAYGSQTEVSYAFVIDDTASMGNTVKVIRDGILQLLKVAPKTISKYIVVRFNDQKAHPWIKSNNVDEITQFLKQISPSGGGSCPNMAMKGIRKAVELSNSDSFVFFFSNASAKDYALQESVVSEARKEGIMILSVLTGCCSSCDSKEFNAYRNIASNSSGRLYKVSEGDVKTFMNYTVLVAAKDAILMRYSSKKFGAIVNITKTGVVPFSAPSGCCNQLMSCLTFCMVFAVSLLATLLNSNIKNLQSVFV